MPVFSCCLTQLDHLRRGLGLLTLPATFLLTTALASTALLTTGTAWAEPDSDAETRGQQIIREADRRDLGWVDTVSSVRMTLSNRQGESATRRLHLKTREVDDDGDHNLIVFDHPADIKGTALLSYAHALRPDQQWLYLPALKRVKRISTANKSGPFVGSEFAFEDITSFELGKYQYRYLRDDMLNGLDCFVVEYTPLYKHSGYKRLEVWLDKEAYRRQQVRFYDRKNTLLKTLTYSEYQQYQNRYWRAGRLTMLNHQTGKGTEMVWDNYQFGTGVRAAELTKNRLAHAR